MYVNISVFTMHVTSTSCIYKYSPLQFWIYIYMNPCVVIVIIINCHCNSAYKYPHQDHMLAVVCFSISHLIKQLCLFFYNSIDIFLYIITINFTFWLVNPESKAYSSLFCHEIALSVWLFSWAVAQIEQWVVCIDNFNSQIMQLIYILFICNQII